MENAPATSNTEASQKLKEIKELVDLVYSLKIEADAKEKAFQAAKNRLSEIMEKAEVDKMAGDECNASLTLKTSLSFPKEDYEKLEMTKYIASQDLDDEKEVETLVEKLKLFPTVLKMFTMNARTFSSWATAETERKALDGDFEFKLPVVKPYEYYSVGLRKRATKKLTKKGSK